MGDGGGKNAAGVHGGRNGGIGAGLMPLARWLLGCHGTATHRTRDGFNGANGRNGLDGCFGVR